jgi:DNA-binding response OmpR family regulator
MVKILVIDDEAAIRDVMKQVLEREGFEVSLASDGKEGLAMLEEQGSDLVITDIIMPGIDGVAMLERIKKKSPGLPVIVISGGGAVAPMAYEPAAISTAAYLGSASKAGADRTLTKPFNREQLLAAVNSVLRPVEGRTNEQ